MIEVVFLAVLLLIPTIYILISVLMIQSATFAVSQAARDAGRLMDSAPSIRVGLDRVREMAAVAATDQRVDADSVRLRFVAAGQECTTAPEVTPTLRPGAVYDICVIAVIRLPGVPSVLDGSRNTVTGVFTLHVGEFRQTVS
ncbi:hypothetical protein JL107_11985 [Nakamurella flavida]|uniref:Pilus assembly protein n=1 Tax=Nakamurella flavida TaxID=363630 RepID=A0A938YPU1_9ACTN|nr:hypothetical protein [Nakamurella flavida]MBM9477169.1 hypothetical protein [Nakamurella flavida]MDP9780118.1 hypothetical protein [Nakamurella flavida]